MSDSDEEALLAETMVEDVLWGYDINITAAHMAASALGMLSPKTQFRNMNIHLAKFGVQGDRAYVGSLEMLHGQLTLEDLPGAVRQIEADDSAGRPEQPPKMDLVIMNPPFTRDSLRYDQFTREEELKLKEHEQLILKGHEFGSAIHLSGTSTPFAVLGDQVLNTETGTLALIMPSVIPTAPSGNGIRQFLAKRFHVETIVSSHDPQRINMSENTNIGEVLIICRRWELDEPKPPTKFYNLAENPATAFDALTLLSQIRRGEQGTFTVQEIESSRIEAGDWNAVNFYSPFLANSTPPPIRTHVLFVA